MVPANACTQSGIRLRSPASVRGRFAALLMLFAILPIAPLCHGRGDPLASVGEAIYRHGISASGKPVEADRAADMRVTGAEAACINCHQRSGLGGKEGQRIIPPVTGRYLFRPRATATEVQTLPYVEGMRNDRDPYTEETLARAIRDGIDASGRPLDYLMPRFALDDADMAALIRYLKNLDPRRLPGVTETVLHFATVITPDADPVKATGMLNVLDQYFADKNVFPVGATPRLHSSRKMMFMANRRWQLHVWRLTGPAESWRQQLERHLAQEPVLAVVSGIGGATWAPVQAFCEQAALPCLFPNVEAPPADADQNFYSLYFSKGVLLEAELIANAIRGPDGGDRSAITVRQVFRSGDSGESAARALAAALARRGVKLRSEVLAADASAPAVAKAVRRSTGADALVLWLRPPDLAALGDPPTKAPATVFMSGLMGGLERSPLPPSWRERTRVAYPFDLPEGRRVRVDYARGWFAIRKIPVVAEQLQADTYLACGLLAETLSHMADTFVRDYLVERVQETLEHRILTGYYPRLTLATGQRFASKGGYFVRFADDSGSKIVAESAWIRP
jgi:mono/diheme cytochrome c family protein